MRLLFLAIVLLCAVCGGAPPSQSQDRLTSKKAGRHVTIVTGDSVSLARFLIEISDATDPGWPTTHSGRTNLKISIDEAIRRGFALLFNIEGRDDKFEEAIRKSMDAINKSGVDVAESLEAATTRKGE